MNVEELAVTAASMSASTVIIVCRGLKGNPGRILFLKIRRLGYDFHPLVLGLTGVKLIREVQRGRKIYPKKEFFSLSALKEDTHACHMMLWLADALQVPYIRLEKLDNLACESCTIGFIRSANEQIILEFMYSKPLSMLGPIVKIGKYRILKRENVQV